MRAGWNRRGKNSISAVLAAGLTAAAVAASLVTLGGTAGSSTFPGNNGKIVFVVETDTADAFIAVINADGSGQTQLTDPAAAADRDPSWSADGTKIVFARTTDDPEVGDIWVMNADGSGQTQLTFNDPDVLVSDPSFSPDGTKIAFGRYAGSGNEIWVMDADGSNQQMLTLGIQPNWSPDGTEIAFTRDEGVWVVNADGTGTPQDLGGGPAESPCWSPDGTTIVFTTRAFPFDTFVMNADGSDLVNLTQGGFGNTSLPCFSPDGTKIVLSSNLDTAPVYQLWVMNADGSDRQQLTESATDISGANWQPIPIPPAPPEPAPVIELVPTFTG